MEKETKHIVEIINAFSEGKKIYRRCIDTAATFNPYQITEMDLILHWCRTDPLSLYIKTEPSYRPYENIEEFLQAIKENGLYLINNLMCNKLLMPITIYGDGVDLYMDTAGPNPVFYSYENLLNYWKHQNGNTCGIAIINGNNEE